MSSLLFIFRKSVQLKVSQFLQEISDFHLIHRSIPSELNFN